MTKKKQVTARELAAKLTQLAATNRPAYELLRDLMWQIVVDNSSRSDFPSDWS